MLSHLSSLRIATSMSVENSVWNLREIALTLYIAFGTMAILTMLFGCLFFKTGFSEWWACGPRTCSIYQARLELREFCLPLPVVLCLEGIPATLSGLTLTNLWNGKKTTGWGSSDFHPFYWAFKNEMGLETKLTSLTNSDAAIFAAQRGMGGQGGELSCFTIFGYHYQWVVRSSNFDYH